MPIDQKQFISQFAQQILDGRTSLFLGAGGSRDAGYPGWMDLFKPFGKELDIPVDENTDYYKLAQYYTNNFGQAMLRQKSTNVSTETNLKALCWTNLPILVSAIYGLRTSIMQLNLIIRNAGR